jgi:hypothetical protein
MVNASWKDATSFLKDGKHQTRITAFFGSESIPGNTNFNNNYTASTGHTLATTPSPISGHRRPTMQSLITKFFPSARPPDINTLDNYVSATTTQNPCSS